MKLSSSLPMPLDSLEPSSFSKRMSFLTLAVYVPIYQDKRRAEGLPATRVCILLSASFLACLTILLSDLPPRCGHVSSSRSHDYATSVKLPSGIFKIRLSSNCMSLFFHARGCIFTTFQGNISRPQATSPCLRTWWYDWPVIDHLASYPPEFIRPTGQRQFP